MAVLLLDLPVTTNQAPNVSLKWGHFSFLQEGKAGFIIQVWSEVIKIQYDNTKSGILFDLLVNAV